MQLPFVIFAAAYVVRRMASPWLILRAAHRDMLRRGIGDQAKDAAGSMAPAQGREASAISSGGRFSQSPFSGPLASR